ncbi:triosephosphate isomerase [Paraburkholderia unamae]|uniref:triose-phosphate isomerase n=1 Tax=Paraburkholderia unamae TaxID=219649 RepID=UPI000DC3DF0C|nr:triose-phosphate isomerase [Paraburkholderia unamae]RAR47913.1 triosephosphate isomerase [Paraburkholderia unamae]
MPKKLVLGNWKMHGGIQANGDRLKRLVAGFTTREAHCDVGVCVPHLYLAQAQEMLKATSVRWGVQDISTHEEGAYTGEVSARMASEFGVAYALAGHSERRTYHGETDEMVAAKVARCLDVGIVPVLCVGETLDERERGETRQVVERQLTAILKMRPTDDARRFVVAYEPVWAIGTGRSASAKQAQDVHAFLRQVLDSWSSSLSSVAILYGGSVKASNADELFAMPDIDGGLIGGASLDANEFLGIIEATQPHTVSQS